MAAPRTPDPDDPAVPPEVPRVLRTGRPELYPEAPAALLDAVVPDAERRAALAAAGAASAMVVPLRARGRVLGAISFVAAESGRRYGAAHLALACDLAERAALAADNARLYREAQAAIGARERFFAVAAHELRSPVTTIRGFAELLVGRLPPGPAAQAARRIVEASTRLTALTDDLLDLTAIRLDQLPLRPIPFDLAALVREVAQRYREQPGTGHRVRAVVEPAPCPVVADRDRLEQVLGNLVDNAIKYGPAGGEIVLTLRTEGEGVLVAVRDEGRGLPPDATEVMFAPFERLGTAAGRALPGLGLGLAICRGIVERHGGRIWAEGAGTEGGTTVRVWLPRQAAQVAHALAIAPD